MGNRLHSNWPVIIGFLGVLVVLGGHGALTVAQIGGDGLGYDIAPPLPAWPTDGTNNGGYPGDPFVDDDFEGETGGYDSTGGSIYDYIPPIDGPTAGGGYDPPVFEPGPTAGGGFDPPNYDDPGTTGGGDSSYDPPGDIFFVPDPTYPDGGYYDPGTGGGDGGTIGGTFGGTIGGSPDPTTGGGGFDPPVYEPIPTSGGGGFEPPTYTPPTYIPPSYTPPTDGTTGGTFGGTTGGTFGGGTIGGTTGGGTVGGGTTGGGTVGGGTTGGTFGGGTTGGTTGGATIPPRARPPTTLPPTRTPTTPPRSQPPTTLPPTRRPAAPPRTQPPTTLPPSTGGSTAGGTPNFVPLGTPTSEGGNGGLFPVEPPSSTPGSVDSFRTEDAEFFDVSNDGSSAGNDDGSGGGSNDGAGGASDDSAAPISTGGLDENVPTVSPPEDDTDEFRDAAPYVPDFDMLDEDLFPDLPVGDGTIAGGLADNTLPAQPFGSLFPTLPVLNLRATTDDDDILAAWNPLEVPDLFAYELFYGTVPGRYIHRRFIPEDITSDTIEHMPRGVTYYLAVRGINDDGIRSDFSNEVAVTIGDPSRDTHPLRRSFLATTIPLPNDGAIAGDTGTNTGLLIIAIILGVVSMGALWRKQLR